YLARQVNADRLVALKMIRPAANRDEDAIVRFRTEARAAARLDHPHVARVYEVGDHDGLPYFSMEFCPEGNLARRLARGPLEPRDAARLVRTLALAMQVAHDLHIIHRDLKPANVLFAADGSPRVSDFGLAKRLDGGARLTQTGAVVGTPSYMAPEQAR